MHAVPTRTRFQRAHGVNARGTGMHDANAQTGLTRTQFSRARTLTHEPCLRTRGLHSPPVVIIQRLGNEGYERLEDMNDCFFWTQILLSSPQVNGMTKTEDMNDSFISSASAKEIVHNLRSFISSCRSYPPTVHILPIGQIRTHVVLPASSDRIAMILPTGQIRTHVVRAP